MKRDLPPILTAETAKEILEGKMIVSLDLGLSETRVNWINSGVSLSGGEIIDSSDLEKIAENKEAAFFVRDNAVYQVAVADIHYYKLLPTDGAPTIEIDGIRMHRTKNTTPDKDSQDKISILGIRDGRVLDTCTGLGYTAIEASRAGAERVITIELQSSVHRIALLNPWSREIYSNNNISCILGDSYQIVDIFPIEFFDSVIHDPPRHSNAGHLYGLFFYKKLFRLLKNNGKLFHYTGEPRSRYRGVNVQKGVSERLAKAGFRDVDYHKKVMGVTARKP